MGYQLLRTLAYYPKEGGDDFLAGEYPLNGIDLAALQALFDVPSEDPMYDCWEVGPEHAKVLQRHVEGRIDLDRYDYFVECSDISGSQP